MTSLICPSGFLDNNVNVSLTSQSNIQSWDFLLDRFDLLSFFEISLSQLGAKSIEGRIILSLQPRSPQCHMWLKFND